MKKQKSLAKTKRKLIPIFSIFIRKRDCLRTTGSIEYGECITCDGTFPFKDLQAGHFVPKHSGNYFSERGVHAQCMTCNMWGRDGQAKGMPHEYRRQMVEMYGEEVTKELEREGKLIKKYTIPDIEEMIELYTDKIEQLNKGVE